MIQKYRKFTFDESQNRDTVNTRFANVAFLTVAIALALYILARYNSFSAPLVDDSAIVMRYLKNFQAGYFFRYNIEDGPVYGISGFWFGLFTGLLCYAGLDPQPALMVSSSIFCALFFYALLCIINYTTRNAVLAIIATVFLYFCTYFLPKTLLLGLEVPQHLWVICLSFFAYFTRKERSFYILCAASVISKLDAVFIIGGLIALDLARAYVEGRLHLALKRLSIYFLAPMVLWATFATWFFGTPVPQSFLSKMFFRQKAPSTSWFPFIEPLVDGQNAFRSIMLVFVSCSLAPLVAILRRVAFPSSMVFACAALGTLALYYVYNPGEKMPWYYPLPELLLISTVVTLPFDAWRIGRPAFRFPITALALLLAFGVIHLRLPMNEDAISQVKYWNDIFEGERRQTGELANSVAPSEHPVLWAGHGYPAYEFNGYIADYSGLNFKGIWSARADAEKPSPETTAFLDSMGLTGAGLQQKTEMLLINSYNANVFMEHGLFTVEQQKFLKLKLAGTFYTIATLNVPAFRVFVKDTDNMEFTQDIDLKKAEIKNAVATKNEFSISGTEFSLPIPDGTTRILFGAKMKPEPYRADVVDSNGRLLGSCEVPAVSAKRPFGVIACETNMPAGVAKTIRIAPSPAASVEIIEPSTTIRP